MKKTILFFCLIILLTNISASCEDNQIDINSASKKELTKIVYIGEVRAEQLIELRPFESIDNLIKIKGIGEITLEKIKAQDLACVKEGEEEDNDENNIQENVDKITEKPEPITPKIIKLNTQTIKTEDDTENSNKNTYVIYSFIIFCVLLGLLFVFRKKRLNKNEFE